MAEDRLREPDETSVDFTPSAQQTEMETERTELVFPAGKQQKC